MLPQALRVNRNRGSRRRHLKAYDLPCLIISSVMVALGMVQPDAPVPGDIARLAGTFEDDESRALAEAMKAMQSLPDDTPY